MYQRDKELIAAYRSGRTMAELADVFVLSVAGVRKILIRHRVKRRRRGPPIKDNRPVARKVSL